MEMILTLYMWMAVFCAIIWTNVDIKRMTDQGMKGWPLILAAIMRVIIKAIGFPFFVYAWVYLKIKGRTMGTVHCKRFKL